MAIKKNDFVEIEYTGRLKEENIIFDTTSEKTAKESNMLNENTDYGPVTVCIGHEQVLRGIDDALIGKEAGKEYKIDLKPGQAFGNKDAKLIQLIPTGRFRQQKIQPMPGLQVNIDGVFGIIKTVSGGRTLVDFNHPLAGKELSYKVKINRKVDDKKEQLIGYLKLVLAAKELEAEITDNKAKITLKMELPKEAQEELKSKLKEVIGGISDIEFTVSKDKKTVQFHN